MHNEEICLTCKHAIREKNLLACMMYSTYVADGYNCDESYEERTYETSDERGEQQE